MPGIQEKLNAIRDRFQAELPARGRAIETCWNELNTDWHESHIKKLIHLSHSLVGSGATFGFAQISAAASKVESFLVNITDTKNTLPTTRLNELSSYIKALMHEIEFPSTQSIVSTENLTDLTPITRDTASEQREQFTIFVIDDDELLAEDLAINLRHFGFKVFTFFHLDNHLLDEAESIQPNAILIDIMFPKESVSGPRFMEEINNRLRQEIPILFMSSQSSLRFRLDAVRAGSTSYITKPVDIGILIDKLDAHTAHLDNDPYHVLIVDDTKSLAQLYSATLTDAGMITAVVNDPMQALDAIIEFEPELILIDLYMPHCGGMELAKVIRQQETYHSTPLVFLSTEVDVSKQIYAMSLGADDFLTKPIDPAHLVGAVRNRVQRYRVLKNLTIKDSLTGLLNHSKINEQLEVEVARAKRHNGTFCFVMIDVDFFKRVNDQYGHLVGDQVLKHLSRLLRKRLRRTDVVGRYGGEEFAVILTDTDEVNAEKLLNTIRKDFSEIQLAGEGKLFSCTFSSGIASFSQFQSAEDLNKAADSALYRAKNAGRDRVFLATQDELLARTQA